MDMKAIILLSVLFFYVSSLLAQTTSNVNPSDTIIKLNAEKIICKVKEIGTTEIKYTSPDFNSELLFSVENRLVDRIVFADGKVKIIDHQQVLNGTIEKNSQDLYQIQRKNALKIDFISLAVNTTSLTYERCLKPGNSIEFSLGAVGLGIADMEEKASGILFRSGYKIIRSPDYFLRDMRYAHILKGRYVKFEFDFASYRVEADRVMLDFNSSIETYNLTKWALLVILGNQWVFNDSFLVDFYSGFGIGNNNQNDLDSSYPYGFLTMGSGSPLAFSLGLRLGFLLK